MQRGPLAARRPDGLAGSWGKSFASHLVRRGLLVLVSLGVAAADEYLARRLPGLERGPIRADGRRKMARSGRADHPPGLHRSRSLPSPFSWTATGRLSWFLRVVPRAHPLPRWFSRAGRLACPDPGGTELWFRDPAPPPEARGPWRPGRQPPWRSPSPRKACSTSTGPPPAMVLSRRRAVAALLFRVGLRADFFAGRRRHAPPGYLSPGGRADAGARPGSHEFRHAERKRCRSTPMRFARASSLLFVYHGVWPVRSERARDTALLSPVKRVAAWQSVLCASGISGSRSPRSW